jgi:hypothetical protein
MAVERMIVMDARTMIATCAGLGAVHRESSVEKRQVLSMANDIATSL